MKAELKDLLAQPLIARGISTRYITSGSTAVVDDIINDARAFLLRSNPPT
jgi:ATP-dependent RNA helicase DDX24/MAK5